MSHCQEFPAAVNLGGLLLARVFISFPTTQHGFQESPKGLFRCRRQRQTKWPYGLQGTRIASIVVNPPLSFYAFIDTHIFSLSVFAHCRQKAFQRHCPQDCRELPCFVHWWEGCWSSRQASPFQEQLLVCDPNTRALVSVDSFILSIVAIVSFLVLWLKVVVCNWTKSQVWFHCFVDDACDQISPLVMVVVVNPSMVVPSTSKFHQVVTYHQGH